MGAFLGNQSGKRDHQEVNCNLLAPLAQESTRVLRAKELDCLRIKPFLFAYFQQLQEWCIFLQCQKMLQVLNVKQIVI